MKTPVSFRIDEDLLAFLRERQEEGEGLGQTARRMLEWMPEILREGMEELRHALRDEELRLVLEALDGAVLTPGTARLLWAEAARRLGDDHPVAARVRSLSPAGRFALADLALRFRRQGGDPRELLRSLEARTGR